MIVYRLSKKQYCTDLSGTGAYLAGGRWNSKGTALLYTAESRALCMAEVAVHLPVGIVPKDYYLVTLEIPDEDTETVERSSLPPDWHTFPHLTATQQIGDNFVKSNQFLALKVPSAVVPGDFNYLLNPQHSNRARITLVGEPTLFPFDSRLFKR
ncbi:MAG: RES family NAD+ phosphorylase [Adhaeribacter sp.]